MDLDEPGLYMAHRLKSMKAKKSNLAWLLASILSAFVPILLLGPVAKSSMKLEHSNLAWLLASSAARK